MLNQILMPGQFKKLSPHLTLVAQANNKFFKKSCLKTDSSFKSEDKFSLLTAMTFNVELVHKKERKEKVKNRQMNK